jgi:hypothetical protein
MGGVGKEGLELVKGLLGLESHGKVFRFFEESIQR